MRSMITLPLCVALLAGCDMYPFKAEVPFETSAELAGVRRVEVETRNGAVTVTCREDAASADIRGVKFARGATEDDARDLAERIEIDVGRDDTGSDTLRIAARIPDGVSSRSPGASFEITLPRDLELGLTTRNGAVTVSGAQRDVSVTTSNGRVEARDVGGKLQARTSNGTIEVADVSGDVDLQSKNGKIEIQRSGDGVVRAETSNGRITALDVKGAATLKTSNGEVELRAVSLPENADVSVRTSNGKVEVELPRAVKAVLEMETGNGSVETDFGGAEAEVLESGKRHVRARLNGGGGTVTVRSGNGSVSFRAID